MDVRGTLGGIINQTGEIGVDAVVNGFTSVFRY